MTVEATDEFLQGLRKDDKLFIFYNLFSILHLCSPDFLDDIQSLKKHYKRDWFAMWHKQFRQRDVCEGAYFVSKERKFYSISGHIDSIMWQTVADSGNKLSDYINTFFSKHTTTLNQHQ